MGITNEDSLFASFREFPTTQFEGAPTYMKLNSLKSQLNTCAASVHCNLGYGNLGYLVLTALPATYTLISMLPFVEPTNVGLTLTMPDMEPTAVLLS